MTIAIPRLDRTTAAERGLTIADFLVPIALAERLNARLRHIVLIVAGALVIFVTAQIYVVHQPVPWTGQTFGVLVVGGALGARRGSRPSRCTCCSAWSGCRSSRRAKAGPPCSSVRPVATSSGSSLAGTVVGRLAELGWDRRLGGALAMMLIGSGLIYAIGLPWLSYSLHLTVSDTIAAGLTPFLVWDAAKLAVAACIFPTAWWLISRRPDDR